MSGSPTPLHIFGSHPRQDDTVCYALVAVLRGAGSDIGRRDPCPLSRALSTLQPLLHLSSR
jgi:hypothetical protein